MLVGGVARRHRAGLVGVCVISTFGVTMVMSQEYLPRRIGMASGLSIGLSIGLGGIAAVGLGAVADSVDLRTAMYVGAAAAVAGLVLAALLPVDSPACCACASRARAVASAHADEPEGVLRDPARRGSTRRRPPA